jgi:CBS domain-containing protein
MKIREVMTRQPTVCGPLDSLASAAMQMWSGDFGMLPVVEDEHLIGVITDRDIAMAAAIQGKNPNDIRVEQVASKRLFTCSPDDEVGSALETMGVGQVRRLPVVDAAERLQGVVSMNDLALSARSVAGRQGVPTYSQVVHAMQGICEHREAALAAG